VQRPRFARASRRNVNGPDILSVPEVTARDARLPNESRPFREAINVSAPVTLAYVDDFLPEDEPLLTARRNAAEVGGADPVGPVTGATLRFVAAAIGARSVVEIGTGCGASGLWLLRGMRRGAVLTSVDVEPEHQRLARGVFVDAGFPAGRYRLISGRALEVLPRLADGAYDLVFCDADPHEYPDYLVAALRLLRPGGVVLFDNALSHGRVADRDCSDPDAVAVRELCEQVRTDERLVPLLLPVGDGLLAAVKRTE
jgi:predicted O-methyltransferase YrrM